jgi:hypothetical protein
MRIYALGRWALVETDEPVEEVFACGVVVVSSLIVWKVVSEWRAGQFLGEEVDIVQE